MKRLVLLRHAKAVPAEQPAADFARALAERGERDALRIGERLRSQVGRPGLILTSPAARALQTAQIVAATLDYPLGDIAVDPRLYLAEPRTLLQVVAAQAAPIEALLVVGHNPGLSELVHELTSGFEVDDLPTAGVVSIEHAVADWAHIADTPAIVSYYDFPKNPRAPFTPR